MSSENLIAEYDNENSDSSNKRGNVYKQTKTRKADYDKAFSDTKRTRNEEGKGVALTGNESREPRLPKKKVAVMIGYCGTGYHGMQYNPPNKTIEEELFGAFVRAGAISKANSTDLKKNSFMRAARTDKGVHAGGNVISLKMIIEDASIKEKINEELPSGIRVWGISRVNKAFDCRKLCSSRWYEYLLPTYSLIGPKPGSQLFKTIEDSKTELPGVLDDDQESVEFWKGFQEAVDKEFTLEEQEAIKNYVAPNKEEFNENDELYRKMRSYKQLENLQRRQYRLSQSKLFKFRDAMNQYIGAHNFHNFTLGKDFKDPSAIRFVKETKVSEPFVIGEFQTEFLSIKIHGQSFMLHQIRKMISMATLITRCGCPVDRIKQAYGPSKINIPKAPALGLLLESPIYEGYNKRLKEFGYDPIDFSVFQKEMDAFKIVNIYDKIYREEVQENVFNAFFNYLDSFNQVTGAQGHESKIDNPSKVHWCIFDFLTAKGIPTETESTATNQIATPNKLPQSELQENTFKQDLLQSSNTIHTEKADELVS